MAMGMATTKGYKSKVGGAHPRPPSKVLICEGHSFRFAKDRFSDSWPGACEQNDEAQR